MKLNKQTILSYENFHDLSKNVIELAKEIMPDKVIYVNFLNDDVQVTMKVSKNDTLVNISEGETIDVANAICNNIDYKKGLPLILEDINEYDFDDNVKETIKKGNIGSYLGIPIMYENEMRFGALCAAHHDKSEFDSKDVELLESIAKLFSYYLVLEHIAYQDVLTKLYNKRFLETKGEEFINNNGIFMMLDLDNFKAVNDTYGHHVGDLVLIETAKKLKKFSLKFKESYAIRLGGDEFVIYINDQVDGNLIYEMLGELIKDFTNWETPVGSTNLSVSLGAIKAIDSKFNSLDEALHSADKLLYKAKEGGKNNFIFSEIVFV